jgi:sarcosine oxidase subunit alpha
VLGRDRLLARKPGAKTFEFQFDDRTITAQRGDSVALALLGANVRVVSRSVKFRRPRGPYCFTGDCGTCLVRIDGRPNRRACLTAASPGMRVESQNVIGEFGVDPTGLADKVFGEVMDHHHFVVKPRAANQIMQSVARRLAGLGTLPDAAPVEVEQLDHRPDVLVVGGGPAGIAVATAIADRGHSILLADRGPLSPKIGGVTLLETTGVFGAYPAEGVWAAMSDAPAKQTLHTIEPRHVVLATGTREPMLPLAGNDLPGVVAGRRITRCLAAAKARIAGTCVVIGHGLDAQACADYLGVQRVEPADVVAIEGSGAVEAVRTNNGRTACDLVVVVPEPSGAYELGVQAGAGVHWDGVGFVLERDGQGRCACAGPWTLWAAGDVCGYLGPKAAQIDGDRVGNAVWRALAG